MLMPHGACTPRAWAEFHFGDAELGDIRRVERVVTIAEAIASNPGASFPERFARWYDLKAAYTLFRDPESTPDALQAGHREAVMDRISRPGTWLLLEDTTEVVYRGRAPIPGFGPVGSLKDTAQACGFLLHSVLVARWPGLDTERKRPPLELVGLADQQYDVRVPRPAGEKRSSSRAHSRRQRESEVWERESERLGPAPASRKVRWVRVCDAAADIYEQLQSCEELGHGHVIFSAQDRAVVCAGTRSRLYACTREAPELGRLSVELSARPGRPARSAHLSVSAVRVEIVSPKRPGQAQGVSSYACTAVRLWEPEPPEGVGEPIEWVLLCDGHRTSEHHALECAQQYVARWLIEEFHKALKSGVGAEKLQLTDGEAIKAAVSVLSVVAQRLVEIKERVRIDPLSPATSSGLDAEELAVLAAATRRTMHTVRDVALAIGRLGGHLNRTRDGMPGWASMMRGLQKLLLLCEGVRLARDLERFR